MKYHPGVFEVLTLTRNPGQEQCMVGSLTGAVSS